MKFQDKVFHRSKKCGRLVCGVVENDGTKPQDIEGKQNMVRCHKHAQRLRNE